MREEPKFDLRIVGGEQDETGLGDEGGADFAAEFGANGNVLEIGIGGSEPPGGGSGLAKGGVHAAAAGANQGGQALT